MRKWTPLFFFMLLIHVLPARANITIAMYSTEEKNIGKSIGQIEIHETKYGLLFTPFLKNLTPGIHGFHVHQNPSCDQNGMAAGGHLDPHHFEKHLGPYRETGHLGDLPALYAHLNQTSTLPVLMPRIMNVKDLKNHTLIIHAHGDNYADSPEKLGGGGARIACGVIK